MPEREPSPRMDVGFSIGRTAQAVLRCTEWFWFPDFFVLVLVLSIAVLVIDSSIVLDGGLGHCIRACDQAGQHRHDSMEHSFQFAVSIIAQGVSRCKNV